MPTVRWGVGQEVVDDFDRESQFKPYDGPLPPNTVYRFRIKNVKAVAATADKNPQLRIGLELIPRNKDERRYKGFYVTAFLPITEKTAWRYVPFLDAIGVSGSDFTNRTRTDEEGNVRRIGRWANDGEQTIKALIEDNTGGDANYPKNVKTFLEDVDGQDDEFGEDEDYEEIDVDDEEYADEEDEDYADEDEYDEEEDEEEPEPKPAPRRRRAAPASTKRRSARDPF